MNHNNKKYLNIPVSLNRVFHPIKLVTLFTNVNSAINGHPIKPKHKTEVAWDHGS